MLNWVLFWTRSPVPATTPAANSSDDAWELVGSGNGPVDADVKLTASPNANLGAGLENGLRARTMLAHAQHRTEDNIESPHHSLGPGRVAQIDASEDTVDEDIDDADDALEDFTDALRRKGTHAYMSRKARRRLKKDTARALNKARASS
ncbi:hypothetical protein HDU81_001495 [Chytriomyces hyalinus]|nr:hypothetical protein HDU81_001495 [Chytriomyces hyalinus]